MSKSLPTRERLGPELAQAERQLAASDATMRNLIKQHGTLWHERRPDYFSSLCRSIIGQQVSVASATSTMTKFIAETDGKAEVTARLGDAKARRIGLSRQKKSYVIDLATHFIEQPDVFKHLDQLDDEEVIRQLTEIRGIGRWTAQMFLMFSLVRLDVFAPDDIGLQRAMQRQYDFEQSAKPAEYAAFAERWQPYRTVASWHLWESLGPYASKSALESTATS